MCHGLDHSSLISMEEVRAMTTTEEIVVSGEDFIERRIFLCPEDTDLADIRGSAYESGYKYGWSHGWSRGFFTAVIVLTVAAFSVWLIMR